MLGDDLIIPGIDMGKLDVKKQLKMNSLLDTAFELFTTNGVSQTSISEISEHAGVAKGTFYLYFKDKLDIRDKLIAYKSSKLFEEAIQKLEEKNEDLPFTESLIFITDYVIDKLTENQSLLILISKNLGWGVFKSTLSNELYPSDINLYEYIHRKTQDRISQPEVMLFMIVELVSSTCYNSIIHSEPLPIEQYKPYLYDTIRSIVRDFETGE